MNLSDATFSSKARTLGLVAALMIVSVYDGELVVTVDFTRRWLCWLVDPVHAAFSNIVLLKIRSGLLSIATCLT